MLKIIGGNPMDNYHLFTKNHKKELWTTSILSVIIGFALGFLMCHKLYTGVIIERKELPQIINIR